MKNKIKIFMLLLAIPLPVNAVQTPPMNGNQNIANVGATDRVQLQNLPASSCSIQAPDTNSGSVYVGGGTVTNGSGANPGIKLEAGDTLSNVSVSNINMIYVAADVADDDVRYVCN